MGREDIHWLYSWLLKAVRLVDNSVPDSWLSAISSLCANVDVLFKGELREGFHWMDLPDRDLENLQLERVGCLTTARPN